MNLDIVKQNTTWNDASGSINTNFEKIRQAILSLQADRGGLDEAELEEYLLANGYTKEEWVLAQNALLEERIENLEQEGGAVNVEGSEFVNVDEDGTISLEIDPQGGLGATEQGLGIVDIPSHLLEGINIDVDSSMSDTSENAVANKVIKKYVDGKAEQAYEQANEYTNEEIASLREELQNGIDHPVFEFEFDSATNKATAEMVAALAEAIAAEKLILCNGRTYKFILEQDGMYGLVSDAYMDITDGKLKTSILAVTSSTYDVQLMEEEVPVGTEITEATISGWGFTKNAGTITGIKMNGATKGTSGVVDLGNVLTEHQKLKTINGQSIVGEGNITIQGGGATPRVEMTAESAAIEPNKFYVWGDAESLNLTLAEGKADELNRYLFQFKTPKTAYTILQLPEDIVWSTDTELDDNDMPVIELSAYHRVEIVDGLATLKRWRIVSKFIEFEDKEFERVLILNGIGTSEGITKKQASALTSIPEWWFANDGALTSLNDLSKFPNLTDLAARAFMGCGNLKTADLSLIETTDGSIFAGCPLEFSSLRTPSLKRLAQNVFPDAYIEEWADMGQITELPEENYGHYGRKDYTKTIVLPSAVKKLPLRTMINYTALENLNTDNIEEFGAACLAYTSSLKPISFASAKIMRQECLSGSGMVVESFVAPNLENLEENALYEFKIKKVANLGKIVTAPRGGTYYESYGARSELIGIIFPASVTTIDVYTLYEYTKLQYIIFLSDVPPTAANDEPFYNTNNCPIYVPDASVEAYKNAANWQRYVGRIRGLSEYTGTI